jgi:two-component system, cell cycle sensor histidine kinase and response regulator CckA
LLQTAKTSRRKSILVIDDDRSVRSAISQTLRRADYNLIEANSPDAAATVWSERQDEIDLILLDILLPGLSGPEFANEIFQQTPVPAKAPIIYMTGMGKEHLKKFQLPQDARLLLKPFAVSELRKLVESTLSEARS